METTSSSSSSSERRGVGFSVEERLDKITRYENFLNEKLKRDLFIVQENRDKVWEEESEYLKLKTVVERIATSESVGEEGLKAKVDLGCNFYAQARVDDPSMIFLDVGLGFHVQLTIEEALEAIDVRVNFCHEKAEKMTQTANRIKAQIRIVMEGLRELSNIDAEDREKYRDVWA